MLYASDRKFSKTLIGDLTFDIERERTRHPCFLNRNIVRVLDHHAKRSMPGTRSSTGPRHNGISRPRSQTDLATPPPRSTRLRDQLIEKFHQEDAELILDVRSIRRKLNYREYLDDRPRKRIKREAVECRCYFTVWNNREGHRQLEPILKRSEVCIVTPEDTASDVHAVEIELESPFRIPARELFVPILSKDGKVTKWAIGDRYLLETKIIPCNTSELWPPIPILKKSDESLTRDLVKRKALALTEGMLISNYTNLPHAPPVGVPLNVAFDQGGRTFKTKYGLEVNAEWTYPHAYEAKLKKGEKVRAKEVEEEERTDPLCRSIAHRLSRPTKINQPRIAKPNVNVSYIWDIETRPSVPRESRTISLEGFHCPVCHAHEFTDLKRLQFHFSVNHDKYKFSVESQEQNLQTEQPKSVVFNVEVAEIVRPRAAKHVKDEREFSWQRPDRPFDIGTYISGEQSWVGAPLRRRAAAAPQHEPSQVANQSTSAQAAGDAAPKGRFRPATEVPNIPLPTRKKFKVPAAKTRKKTSFYRSINHRRMETGELLSETDEDIDDDWLIKKHHDTIAEAEGLTEVEKRFRQKWDAHVMSEGCPSSRYVSDSLIRFVRDNAAWLRSIDGDAGMFIQFQEFTSLLMERRVIDARILRDCLQIIGNGNDQGEEQTFNVTGNAPDRSLGAAAAAAADGSTGSQKANPREPSLPVPKEWKKKDREGARHVLNANGYFEGSQRGQNTATQSPEPGPMPRTFDVPQQRPISSNSEREHHATADGFCAICNKYIHQPKRKAITCSNLVSPIYASLSSPLLCFGHWPPFSFLLCTDAKITSSYPTHRLPLSSTFASPFHSKTTNSHSSLRSDFSSPCIIYACTALNSPSSLRFCRLILISIQTGMPQ